MEGGDEVQVLFAAAERGRTDIARAVCDRLAAENLDLISKTRESDGATALHTSAVNGHLDVTRALLRAGAAPDVRGSAGSFLGKTAFEISEDSVKMAFINELYQQVALGCTERTRALLRAGVDPNSSDGSPTMDRPLHWASNFGNVQVMEILLNAGADPNAQNVDGATPLHEACRLGRADVVTTLLRAGADPSIKGTGSVFAGVTALELAEKSPLAAPAQLRAIKHSLTGLPTMDDDAPQLDVQGFAQDSNPNPGARSASVSPSAAAATAAAAARLKQQQQNGGGGSKTAALNPETRAGGRSSSGGRAAAASSANDGPTVAAIAAATAAVNGAAGAIHVSLAGNGDSGGSGGGPSPSAEASATALNGFDTPRDAEYVDLREGECPLPLLWPPPRRVTILRGCECVLRSNVVVVLPADLPHDDLTWLTLRNALDRHGLAPRVSRGRAPLARDEEAYIVLQVLPRQPAQMPDSFSLVLSAELAIVSASDGAGLFYGVQTLCQMLDLYSIRASALSSQTMAREFAGLHLPAVAIKDWPEVGPRVVTFDLRFPYLPTLEALLASVEKLAAWRVNGLYLVLDRRTAAWIMDADGERNSQTTAAATAAAAAAAYIANGGSSASNGGWSWGALQEIVHHCQRHHITLMPGWRVLESDAVREGWRESLQLLSVYSRQLNSDEVLVVFSEGLRLALDDESPAEAAAAGKLPLGRCLSNLVVACAQRHVTLAGLDSRALSSLQAAPYLPSDCAFAVPASSWRSARLSDGIVERGVSALAPLVGPVRLAYIVGGSSSDRSSESLQKPNSVAYDLLGSAELEVATALESVRDAVGKAAIACCGVLIAARPSANMLYPNFMEEAVVWAGAALCWGSGKAGFALDRLLAAQSLYGRTTNVNGGERDTDFARGIVPGALNLVGMINLPAVYARSLLGNGAPAEATEAVCWALKAMLETPTSGYPAASSGAAGTAELEAVEAAEEAAAGLQRVEEAVGAAVWGLYNSAGGALVSESSSSDRAATGGHSSSLRVPPGARTATRSLYGRLLRLTDGAESRRASLAGLLPSTRDAASLVALARAAAVVGEMARVDRMLRLSCRIVHMLSSDADQPHGLAQQQAQARSAAAAFELSESLKALSSSARSDLANSALLGFRELCRGWMADRQRVVLPEVCEGLRVLVRALTFDLPSRAFEDDLVSTAIFG